MAYSVYLSKESFLKDNSEQHAYLPFSEDTSVLAEPLTVGGKLFPNRLVCQAMEGCDGTADGRPSELTRRRYERFARGGAGLIWFEATAAMEEGRANTRQLYINKKTLDSFKAQVENIKETAIKANGYEPIVIMQCTHSGRYSKPHGVPEPLIAYNNPIFEKDDPIPSDRIVTDEYLDRVKDALSAAPNWLKRRGLTALTLNAATDTLTASCSLRITGRGATAAALKTEQGFCARAYWALWKTRREIFWFLHG